MIDSFCESTFFRQIQLFYRTENVRENTFVCTEYTEARHWYRKHTSGVPLLTKKQLPHPDCPKSAFSEVVESGVL